MKHYVIAVTVVLASLGQASAAPTPAKLTMAAKSTAKDTRQGIRADRLLKGEIQTVLDQPQQTGGAKPLLSSLFKPTLAEWMRNGQTQQLTKSKLIREGDTPEPVFKDATIEEVADLSQLQYFYNESLHAELIGKRAVDILNYTHAEKGRVFVSTTVDKVYPMTTYLDDDTGKEEHSQCIDILTRTTVTNVPLVNSHGLKQLVDFWSDIKSYQCRSDSQED